MAVKAILAKNYFELCCRIPEQLGCELTDEGYMKADHLKITSISNIYACGDVSLGDNKFKQLSLVVHDDMKLK